MEDDEDLPLVAKAVRAAFNRHMRFSATTADKIVRACARAGKPTDAVAMVAPGACEAWRLPVTAAVLDQLMLEVAVKGDEEGMDALLADRLAAPRPEHRPTTRTLFYYARGVAEAGSVDKVTRAVMLAHRRTGKVPDAVWAAAAPALITLGPDLAPESASGVRRVWRLFGLVAGRCAHAASEAGAAREVFSVNGPVREAARLANPGAVAAASTKMPKRLVDAFDALSGAKPPARTAVVLEAVATVKARGGAPAEEEAEAQEEAQAADGEAAEAQADAATEEGEVAAEDAPKA